MIPYQPTWVLYGRHSIFRQIRQVGFPLKIKVCGCGSVETITCVREVRSIVSLILAQANTFGNGIVITPSGPLDHG